MHYTEKLKRESNHLRDKLLATMTMSTGLERKIAVAKEVLGDVELVGNALAEIRLPGATGRIIMEKLTALLTRAKQEHLLP